jgi:conserved hypothetical protein, ribA/ribD-fused
MKIIGTRVYFYRPSDMFSNHYICPMEIDGIVFNCVEQYMMYQKAILFGDTETAKMIINEPLPKIQKQHGRSVKGFDDALWNVKKFDIVYKACYHKFHDTELIEGLDQFAPYEFVEASPTDKIWGIGISIDDTETIMDETKWQGANLLGQIITEVVREVLLEKAKQKRI